MKAVLISIQPKWCELIASGKKTIEVRKTRPKIETPFKCYIYETNWAGNSYWAYHHKGKLGKVIGEFVCSEIEPYTEYELLYGMDEISNSIVEEKSCVDIDELLRYKGKNDFLYGWHISALKIYDKAKELGEFVPTCKYQGERCDICVFNEEAFGGCCRILTRPPQSWCYIEVEE